MTGRARRRLCLVVGAFVAVVLVVVPGRSVESSGEFVALPSPVRLLDTRPGAQTIDGAFAGIGQRPAGSTLQLDVAGRAGLPADAANVVVNVTAVDAAGWGYVTVHPSGSARPNASNLNFDTGETIANVVITPLGGDGDLALFTFAPTHLLVDAVGYLPADAFDALPAAARLLDTRPGAQTIDGAFAGIGQRPAGSTLQLDVAGRAGIPVGATSAVLNVTATMPDGWGFVTVHPSGTARPNASNLNYDTGQTIANTVVTSLGADGRVSIYTYGASDLIVDVAGHLPAAAFTPLPSPARILDTRLGAGTIDGSQAGIGLRPASSTVQVDVAGRAGIPADASSVVLNVTAVDTLGWGFVTEFPTGSPRPNASNLNYDEGRTIANTVVARLGAGGDVCLYTYWATHLIVDVVGHLSGPPPPASGPTCPPMSYDTPRVLGANMVVSDVNNAGIMVGATDTASLLQAAWWPSVDSGPLPLPGLPALRSSHATAINDLDQVLVSPHDDATDTELLVLDLRTGRVTWLPDLAGVPGLAGLDLSRVTGPDMNDRGEVVVNLIQGDHDPDGAIAVWNSNTGEVRTRSDLHDLAWAYDINDVGHVVGTRRGADGLVDAFSWDLDTDVVHELDPGSFTRTWPRGVNDRGQIVGSATAGTGGTSAVIWADRDAPPAVVPGPSPVVDAINEAGLTLGHTSPAGSSWDPPGVWDAASGAWLEIPVVWPDGFHAVNDVGVVVGATGDDPRRVAIWQPR